MYSGFAGGRSQCGGVMNTVRLLSCQIGGGCCLGMGDESAEVGGSGVSQLRLGGRGNRHRKSLLHKEPGSVRGPACAVRMRLTGPRITMDARFPMKFKALMA